MFAMAAVLGIVTIMAQQRAGALGFVRVPLLFRIENGVVSTVAYLGKMIWVRLF